jgi:hypothetical protein
MTIGRAFSRAATRPNLAYECGAAAQYFGPAVSQRRKISRSARYAPSAERSRSSRIRFLVASVPVHAVGLITPSMAMARVRSGNMLA